MSESLFQPAPERPPADAPAISSGKVACVRVLLAGAILLAIYLTWLSVTTHAAAGCGPSSGCTRVLASSWSSWARLPVGVLGALVYLGLLAATFAILEQRTPAQRLAGASLAVCLGTLVLGAALWFTGVQLLVIKAFCPYCLAAHGLASLAALILLAQVFRRSPDGAAMRPSFAGRLKVMIALGVGGVLLLALGQVLLRPQINDENFRAFNNAIENRAGARNGLILHHGDVEVALKDFPLMGPAEAPHVMLYLFDYTCPHCRRMHGYLREIREQLGSQVAILCLPVPLDSRCNPLVRKTEALHLNACELAKIALTVARLKPGEFAAFDAWLFDQESPLSILSVRARAEQLLGKEALAHALNDGVTSQPLRTSMLLYQLNLKSTGAEELPELVVGTTITSGVPDKLQNLHTLLREQWGIRPVTR